MDKIRTKQVWLSLACRRRAMCASRKGDDVTPRRAQLGLPVIVKPSCEGSSVGVSRVFTDADLEDAVALAARIRANC